MSIARSRGRKALLAGLSLACLGLVGGIVYVLVAKPKKSGEQIQDVEKDYAAGIEAYEKGDGKSAAEHFDRARLRAEKILQGIENPEDMNTSKSTAPELQGKLHYLRARAIRDSFYAKGLRDGKPLKEADDTSTNEKYRNFTVIPDPKEQNTAIASLRIAADRLTKDPEVLRDSLRIELVMTPLAWDRITVLCQQILETNPRDGRALYQLARSEFFQPTLQSGWRDTDPAKRAVARVEKSLQYVRRARQSESSPYWRTVYLEAQVLLWLERELAKKKSGAEHRAELRTLLFDPATSALARVRKMENVEVPHQLDLEGLLGIQRMAVQILAEESRTAKARTEELAEILTLLVDISAKARTTSAGKANAASITVNLLQAAGAGQSLLARAPHAAWPKVFDAAWSNAEETEATNLNRPEIILMLADLNATESYFYRKRGNVEQGEKLEKRLFAFLKDALEDAEKQKRPVALKDMLHRVALQTKYRAGLRGDELAAHIEALKLSTRPDHQARAGFYEGLLAQRQGRLAKARTNLEAVIANRDLKDLHFPARLELIQILLALGQPEAALVQLREIEPALERPDELAPSELAWRDEVIQTTDNFRTLMVVAQLETAIGRIIRHLRENPGQALPADLTSNYEKGAETYLIRLKSGSTADRTARLAFFNYWMRLGRREAAGSAVKELENRFPDNLSVLEARVRFTLLGPEKTVEPADIANRAAREKIDGMLQEFIAKRPMDRDAKLFWARWLLQTNRNAEAIAYLEDKKNFEDQKDAVVARTLAQALIRQGKPEAASRLLDAFPADPSIDIALIQAAGDREAQEKKLTDALKRYESTGLIRLYEASLRLNDGKFEEAIEGFLHATEFQQLKAAAQAGLLRSLMAYATEKPGAARDLAVRLMKEFPKEPILAIAVAVASFNLDDIGTPASDWTSSRSMGAALARWEQIVDQSLPRPAVGHVKAQFWSQAGKPDYARQELLRGMGKDGNHLPSLNFLLALAIESRNTDQIKQVRDWIVEARKKDPKNVALALLEGRLKEFEGPIEAVLAFYQIELINAPKQSVFYDRLVGYLFREGKKAEALEWARKWREALPDDQAARLAIVQTLAAQGEADAARKTADEHIQFRMNERKKQLAEVKPPPATSAAFKDWPKRQQDLLDEVARASHLDVATMFFRAKRFDETETYAKGALKTMDDYVPALLLLGDTALAKKSYPEACKYYRAILDKSPRHLAAANNLAYTLAENLGSPDEAMKVVDKFRTDATGGKPIGVDRLPAAMLDTLGVVYLKLKQPAKYQEMRQIFEDAVQRYPRDPRMHLYLGQACIELGFKNQAIPYLRAAEKIVSTPGFKDLPAPEVATVKVAIQDALKRVGN